MNSIKKIDSEVNGLIPGNFDSSENISSETRVLAFRSRDNKIHNLVTKMMIIDDGDSASKKKCFFHIIIQNFLTIKNKKKKKKISHDDN